MERAPASSRRLAWRLFFTVWLVYAVFATTNVVRETYLAMSLGTNGSVRVDPYHDLHPDLFEMPGRGWYINSNPGASIVGAVPYALLVRPVIALATRLRPGIVAPRPPATYDDPRPNRTRFMNEARARGLDIVLGLAALGTGVTVMAPLGALAAVMMFLFLAARLDNRGQALVLAVVFAFATPMFFRAAFLNQNVLVAHLVLFAWILKAGLAPRPADVAPGTKALMGIGLLLGFALVVDFSAIPFAVVFGLWILADAWRRGGVSSAIGEGSTYVAGALICLTILFWYQWAAFGSPIWPAQHYMPPTEFSVRGWFGFTMPTFDLMWRNLLDSRYGLFVFCPLLLLAFAAPLIRPRSRVWSPSRSELGWIGVAFVGLLLFNSANQFANLQFNTGVRYMVPVAPLLFLAVVPVLLSLPRVVAAAPVALSLLITIAVSMTREAVPTALRLLVTEGPTLPVLTVLRKMSSGYDVTLPGWSFWIVALVLALVLYIVWRPATIKRATA
jgi:hypothetical protein